MNTTAPVKLGISTRLMEDYRYTKPLREFHDFVASQDKGDYRELFYIDEGSRVKTLREDPASESGWSLHTLSDPSKSFRTAQLAVCLLNKEESDDRDILFAASDNAEYPQLSFLVQNRDGSWPEEWTDLPIELPEDRVQLIDLFAANFHGEPELFLVLSAWQGPVQDPPHLWHFQASLLPTPQETELKKGDDLGEIASPAIAFGLVRMAGDGVFFVVDQADLTQSLMFRAIPLGDPAISVLSAQSIDAVATVRMDNGSSAIFVDTDRNGETPQQFYIDGSAEAFPPRPETCSAVRCNSMLAVRQGTACNLLMIDTRSHLNIVRRAESGGWLQPVNVWTPLKNMIQRGNSLNVLELLGFDKDDQLRHIIQDALASEDMPTVWETEIIQIQELLDPKQVPQDPVQVYATQVTVMDAEDTPLPMTPVNVFAADSHYCSINGEFAHLGPATPVQVITDARGVLTFSSETNALSTTQLRVEVPGLSDEGFGSVIRPNQDTIALMKDWKESDVKAILPDRHKDRSEDVYQVVKDMLSLSECSAPNGSYLPSGDFGNRIDFSLVPDQCWRVRITSEGIQRTELAHAEFETYVGSFDGFFDFIGDAFESLVNVVVDTVEYAVEKVGDVFNVVIDVVIDGIHFVFNGKLKFIEEGLRLVQSFFNALSIGFVKLFQLLAWLITGAFKDIWENKEKIEKLIDKAFKDGPGMLQEAARQIPQDFFAEQVVRFEDKMDQILNTFGRFQFNLESILGPGDGSAHGSSFGWREILALVRDNMVEANWLLNKVVGRIDTLGLGFDMPTQIVEDAKNAAESYGTLVTKAVEEFAKAAFDFFGGKGVKALQRLDFQGLIQELLQPYLNPVKKLDDVFKSSTKITIQTLTNVREKLLNRSIGNIALKCIYNLIAFPATGSIEEPTVKRLAALLFAVPYTVVEKLLGDARLKTGSPYPDEANHDIGYLAAVAFLPVFSGFLDVVDAKKVNPRDPDAQVMHVMECIVWAAFYIDRTFEKGSKTLFWIGVATMGCWELDALADLSSHPKGTHRLTLSFIALAGVAYLVCSLACPDVGTTVQRVGCALASLASISRLVMFNGRSTYKVAAATNVLFNELGFFIPWAAAQSKRSRGGDGD